MFFYDMPLYRPPSEANSVILQATIGCSHNKCTFCSMYKDKKFKIKDLTSIKKDIDYLQEIEPLGEKFFIADGDALILNFTYLIEILKYIKIKFPLYKHTTLYGTPKSILLKTPEELKQLKELGLSLIYMGIESGSDLVLTHINKGVTKNDIITAGKKVMDSGIQLSTTLIAGLGGREFSSIHAIESADVISKIQPTYLAILTLLLENGTKLYEEEQQGLFNQLNNIEILKEIKTFLSHIDTENNIIFRSNHASNYVNLGGTLPNDVDKILKLIDYSIDNSDFKHRYYRQL